MKIEIRQIAVIIHTESGPYFTNGKSTFIPKKLVMNVGTIIIMFRIERRFM